jgi:hypothetical protein
MGSSSLCFDCQIPNCVPLQIGQGTTVKFTRTFNCFSAKDFGYTIYFNGASSKFSAAGVPNPDPVNGPGWLVTINAAATKSQTPGAYRYCERLLNPTTSEVYDPTGETLVSNLVASPADAPPGAFQTYEEKTVAVLEAAISGDLSTPIQSYSIAGRSVSKYSINDLAKMLGTYKSIVWRQQHPGRLGVSYRVAFPMMEPAICVPPTWVYVTTIG